MKYSVRDVDALNKNFKNKIFSLLSVVIIGFNGLAVATPFFLTQTAYANGNLIVCQTNCKYPTVQSAINAANPGDTITVGAGTYGAFTIEKASDLTIVGAGAGETYIQPTTLIDSGTGHKYTSDMKVSVLVKNSSNISISGMTVQGNGQTPGSGGADALVFWDASTGSLNNDDLMGNYTINGAQTGQGLAVDSSGQTQTQLNVNNTNISGFQKNGIDAVDGNATTTGNTDQIILNINGGSIKGAGQTSTIAQNGILAWNQGGGSVSATVNGTSISDLHYTGGNDSAVGILAFGAANIKAVSNVAFNEVDSYIDNVGGGSPIDATAGNSFDGVSPANATVAQLGQIEDKLYGRMEDSSSQPIFVLPNTWIATLNNRQIQAAINEAASGDTVVVAPGTYNMGSLNINKPLTLEGAQRNVAGASSNGDPRSGNETIISNHVNVSSNDTVLNGFTFNNPGNQLSLGSVNSISQGLVVENNIFKNYSSVGIPTENAGNLNLNGNYFTAPASNSEPMQIKASLPTGCSGTTLNNNVFSYATSNGSAEINMSCTGSNSSHVTISGNSDLGNTNSANFVSFSGINDDINVTNNIVKNSSGSALFFWGGLNGNTTISGNSITEGGASAISILNMGAPYGGVSTGTVNISNNDLSGNNRGLYLDHNSFSDASKVTLLKNNLSNEKTAGIDNEASNTSSLAVNAQDNWWGSVNGPNDSVSNDGSLPATNQGSGSHAIGAVVYGPWCTQSDCSVDSNQAPGVPTNLRAKFQYDSTYIQNGSYLTINAKPQKNNLELLWDASSGLVSGYHILATYPNDPSTHTIYQGNNTNAWLGVYDGFGQHGNGKYTYQIVGVNNNKTSNPSSIFTLYYDTQKPQVSLTDPTPAANTTINHDFSVGYEASDNVALQNVNVDLFDTVASHANHWVATCYSKSNETTSRDYGTCTVHLPASLPDGKYYIQVGAQDMAGNWSVNATRTIFVDRTAPSTPAATFTADSTGKTLASGSATNSEHFTFNLNNPVADGVTRYQLKYWNNIASSPFNINNPWNPSDLSGYSTSLGVYKDQFTQGQGTHYFAFSACDAAGNCSPYSSPFIITYDTTRPELTFTSPTSFSDIFTAPPSININASDSGSGLSSLAIHVYDSTNKLLDACGSATSAQLAAGSFSCDLTGLANGVYSIKAGAFDEAGNNTTISSGNFTIDSTVLSAPNLISPLNNQYVNGATLTNAWSAVPGAAKYEYESFNSADTSLSPRYDSLYTSTSKTATNVTDGTSFYWRVRAIDQFGKDGPWSNLWQVNVDNTPPTMPVATPKGSNNSAPFNVELVSSDSGSGVKDIYYTTDGSTPNDTGNGTLYKSPIYVSGDETIKAIAYDNAGNASPVMSENYNVTPTISYSTNVTGSSKPSQHLALVSPLSSEHSVSFATTDNGQVLGDSTTLNPTPHISNSGHVKGDSTVLTEKPSQNKNSNFLGLGWWWLAILAILTLIWWIMAHRRSNNAN